jgi:hypothetical protein
MYVSLALHLQTKQAAKYLIKRSIHNITIFSRLNRAVTRTTISNEEYSSSEYIKQGIYTFSLKNVKKTNIYNIALPETKFYSLPLVKEFWRLGCGELRDYE